MSSTWSRFSQSRSLLAVGLIAASSLVLGACTGDGSAVEVAEGADTKEAAEFQIQDLWMVFDIRGVEDDGELTSLLDETVAEIRDGADDPVELTEFLSFSPLPDLEGAMVSPYGEVREEVDLTFGLFGMPEEFDDEAAGEATLGIVTSAPAGVQNVATGDELVFDTAQISALEKYDDALLDFAFGQARPSKEDAGGDQWEVLQSRFANESVTWVGTEEESADDLTPAMWRGVPLSSTSPAVLALQDGGPSGTAGGLSYPSAIPGASPGGAPIKGAFTGAGGIALTAFCFAGTIIVTGGAGVLFGSVFCTLIGGMSALNDAMTAINDNSGGGKGRGGPGGSTTGDPHVTTFDGARRDLMTVGEFVMVESEDMEVQTRTAPIHDSRTVSYNTAAAMNVAGDTVVIDTQHPDDIPVVVNDEELPIDESGSSDLPQGGVISHYGNTYDIEWPDGRAVVVKTFGNNLDATVFLEGSDIPVTGLLGDADGDRSNDFISRDGEGGSDIDQKELYEVVADSWRVEEDANLFDTPLTHDESFPDGAVTISEAGEKRARAICEAQGLTGDYLDNCILDVSQTGESSYALRAMLDQGVHDPENFAFNDGQNGHAGEEVVFEQVFADAHHTGYDPQIDGDDHLFYVVDEDERDEVLHGFSIDDGSALWDTELGGKSCGFAATDSHVVASTPTDDGLELSILDSSSGEVLNTIEHSLRDSQCLGMSVVEDLVLIASMGDEGGILAIDPVDESIAFDEEIPDIAGLALPLDENTYWVPRDDGEGNPDMARGELNSGKITNALPLPGDTFASTGDMFAASTTSFTQSVGDGGFVTATKEENAGYLVGSDANFNDWEKEFPVTVDDQEYSVPISLGVGDGIGVGYSGDESVLVFDSSSGQVESVIKPSSFNNNKSELDFHAGKAVVGPFGGDAWVEAYDPETQELAWSFDRPIEGLDDIKRITSLGEVGVAVQSSGKAGTALYVLNQ